MATIFINREKMIILFLLLPLALSSSCYAQKALPEWTILTCLGANNNLSHHGFINVTSMQRAGSNDKVNILVQLDEPQKNKTRRFKICKGSYCDDVSTNQPLGLNQTQELIDAARWAHTTYPSQFFSLGFWNHGNGILDEPKKWEDYIKKRKLQTRGILYNFTTKTYLTNENLKEALTVISNNVLHKKIDILGMDACLMAMIEVAYQVKDTALYLVASQNIEVTPGWNYAHHLSHLVNKPSPTTPVQFAKNIVSSFMHLNKHRNTISTQSVIDLQHIESLKNSLDLVVKQLLGCLDNDIEQTKKLILQARKKAMAFYDDRYIDLASFFTNILTAISKSKNRSSFSELTASIHTLLKDLKLAVVFSQAGTKYAKASGLSIYFPEKGTIHHSYTKTDFALSSLWLTFLQRYLMLFF